MSSIPVDQILDGGPGKDGIPALTKPDFVSISESGDDISGEEYGLLVIGSNNTKKFYPYSILVWYEIVNDEIDGAAILVTFCPLCASAIVFSPIIDNVVHEFGVSGKLYESNLLMYDRFTDSLWSQILGEAVVGEKVGQKLTIIDSERITYENVISDYPGTLILSTDTGYQRDYDKYPYGNYDTNSSFYFPTTDTDSTFAPKDLFYIVDVNTIQMAFKLDSLTEIGEVTQMIGGEEVTIKHRDEISATNKSTGEKYPGFYAMWFSWRLHNESAPFWPSQ